ncbi:hypothetical protein [Synechococcus phage BUCT-ZZ01]|nr:hypothetical protein [Synechococcus phage BUCT-ZZ01]
MLSKQPFYHGIIRKATVAFGGLFSNIYLRNRFDDPVKGKSKGTTEKIIKIPIAYANKDKMLTRLNSDPATQENLLVKLPRLSFEIMGYNYAAERALNKTNYRIGATEEDGFINYTPAPYDIEFALYSYTKTTEDNLQVIEQILPYFRPDLTLNVKMMPELGESQKIPLVLNSIVVDEIVEGSLEDRRAIITTFSFTMKLNVYAPLLGVGDPENHFDTSGGNPFGLVKHVIVDLNTGKYTADVVPEEANIDDVFEIVENWTYEIPQNE